MSCITEEQAMTTVGVSRTRSGLRGWVDPRPIGVLVLLAVLVVRRGGEV